MYRDIANPLFVRISKSRTNNEIVNHTISLRNWNVNLFICSDYEAFCLHNATYRGADKSLARPTSRCIFLMVRIFRLMLVLLYTGCHRRNGPNFGKVFLMLNYTDITQNTYIQSWTVTEIMVSEVWNFDSCYTLIDYQIHIKTGRNMWFL